MQWHSDIDVTSKFNKVYNIWPDCVAGNLHPVLCESASAHYLFASLLLSVLTFAQCAEAVLICMLSCFCCQDNETRTKVMETQNINFKLYPVAAKILFSQALCFLTEFHQTGGSVSPWTTMFLHFLGWSLSGVCFRMNFTLFILFMVPVCTSSIDLFSHFMLMIYNCFCLFHPLHSFITHTLLHQFYCIIMFYCWYQKPVDHLQAEQTTAADF